MDLEKLYGLLDMKPEITDAPDAIELAHPVGSVAFEHVSFSHEGRAVGVEDVSLIFSPARRSPSSARPAPASRPC